MNRSIWLRGFVSCVFFFGGKVSKASTDKKPQPIRSSPSRLYPSAVPKSTRPLLPSSTKPQSPQEQQTTLEQKLQKLSQQIASLHKSLQSRKSAASQQPNILQKLQTVQEKLQQTKHKLQLAQEQLQQWEQQAIVFIETHPNNAAIWIDGVKRGEGRAWLRALPGRIMLRVTHAGFLTSESEISLTPKLCIHRKITLQRVGTIQTVELKQGEFLMGSADDEPVKQENEQPPHRVRLTRGFHIMKYEVTQEQFEKIMGYNPSKMRNCGATCPVEHVSWHEATAFANALSRRDRLTECYRCTASRENVRCTAASSFQGLRYTSCPGWRLPTEAEWEYAARAGTQTTLYSGALVVEGHNNSPSLDPIAWYGGNSGVTYQDATSCERWPEKQITSTFCGTHPVGGKRPNPWGLYDMLGNVAEWVYDGPRNYRTQPEEQIGPLNTARGTRGGSWIHRPAGVRSAHRSSEPITDRESYVGFRLVRSTSRP